MKRRKIKFGILEMTKAIFDPYYGPVKIVGCQIYNDTQIEIIDDSKKTRKTHGRRNHSSFNSTVNINSPWRVVTHV